MPWVSLGLGALSAAGGIYSSNKAAGAQSDALDQQMQMQQMAAKQYQPYTKAGKASQRQLDFLMGTTKPKTEADLMKQIAKKYTTYVKEDSGGGLGGTIAKSLALGNESLGYKLADPAGLGVGSMIQAPKGYKAIVDEAGLKAEVARKMARPDVTKKEGYGMLAKQFTGEDLQNEPGYMWRLKQGEQSVQAGQAARGGLFSGAAGKELLQYGQGFASNEFGNAYARDVQNKNRLYDMYSNIANRGQNAATGQANQYNAMGNTFADMGANRASGYMGQANALTGAIGQGLEYRSQQNQIGAPNYWAQQSQSPSSSGASFVPKTYGQGLGMFPVKGTIGV